MSPSLPLLPKPMVNIWPSNSLQTPTSDAFLGMVALAPLPQPHWPWPALLSFPPHPPQPALEVQAIFSCLEGPTDGRTIALAKNIPRIKYPGFCRAVSSMESCKSTFFASFPKPHEPFVIACLLREITRLPRQTCMLGFLCPSSPQACTRYNFCECVGGIQSGRPQYANLSLSNASVDRAGLAESVLEVTLSTNYLEVAIRHLQKL
jgi:hypothetical protein